MNGSPQRGSAVDGRVEARGAHAQQEIPVRKQPARVRSIEASRPRLGRYELITELASGGMGVVYLGRLQGVGGFERLFAIKVLHKHLAQKPQIVAMLLNEARLAAQIQHPNVVSTVDAQVSSSGEYYVVMEYVDGVTLCELLDHPTLDAVRRVRFGLRILLDAMAGLDAAHRLCSPADGTPLGIVHRDVSPTNILVSLQGAGMIADFGIARATAAQNDALPGLVKGTPCYMAPEQLTAAEPLDARADVFSLGAVLWEVLTGEQLFYSPAGVDGVFALVQSGEIQAPSSRNSRVPPALDAVCLKALERDLGGRYWSVRELYEALERVAREQDLIATAHETAEALPALFAEQIERRRALLPATDVSSSALVPIPESLRASPAPPPPLPPAHAVPSAPAPVAPATDPAPAADAALHAAATPLADLVLRAVADAAAAAVADAGAATAVEMPVARRRRAPWRLGALAAGLIALIAALTWLVRSQPHAERKSRAPAPASAMDSRGGARDAHEPPTTEPVRNAVRDELPATQRARKQGDLAIQPARARGRDRAGDPALTRHEQPRPFAPTVRAPRAAAVPAPPHAMRPYDPAADPTSVDDRDEPALEANPYLIQR